MRARLLAHCKHVRLSRGQNKPAMRKFFLYGFAILMLQIKAVALDSDRMQVMNAHANNATINQQTGISLYQDHVVATQGTTSLFADTVIIKQDSHHQLTEVIAYGKPAMYKTIPEVGKAELTATALEIHYYPLEHRVQLLHDAVVIQEGNRYAAPLIYYDLLKQTVQSPASTQGHTTILLMPHTFSKKTTQPS